jgi:hypothetical protein
MASCRDIAADRARVPSPVEKVYETRDVSHRVLLIVGSMVVAAHFAKVVAGAFLLVSVVFNLILIPMLNPVFDPDWLPHDPLRDQAGTVRQRFVRASMYSFAVLRGKIATPWFEGGEYDYRKRVRSATLLICRLYAGCLAASGLSTLLWGIFWMLGRAA